MMNSMICSAVAGLLSAMLVDVSVAISGPTDRAKLYRDRITALGQDIRATKVADKLDVNTGRKFRLVFPNKCEKEGEFELHRLASSAGVEESFVFIPDLCLWIEVGRDESQHRVRLDMNFVDGILEQFHSLIFYHIHTGDLNDLENFFPAYKDLISLVLINGGSIRKPHIRIKHRFVSNSGVMEYGFSNKQKAMKFMDQYKKSGLRGFEEQNLAYEYMRPKYRMEYYNKIQKCKSLYGTFKQKIAGCCPLKTEAFVLSFRPVSQEITIKTGSTDF